MEDLEEKEIAIFNALTNADNTVLVKAVYRGSPVSVVCLLDEGKTYPMAILINDIIAEGLEPDPENFD